MTGDPVLREAQHAETHAEPSDEQLEKIARMPRSISPSDLEPNPSVSVGYPNRGLLRFGMRINDDRDLRVKVGGETVVIVVVAHLDLSHDGNGAPGRTRTYDIRLRRPALYPAELRAREPAGGGTPSAALPLHSVVLTHQK